MEFLARSSRAVWWSFAFAGIAAIVAAAAAGAALIAPLVAIGAWQLASGIAILAALVRSPDGVRAGIPFAGVALVSIVLGAAGIVLQGEGTQVALLMTGLWSVVAGASLLAVSSILMARRIADPVLRLIAYAAIIVGVVSSSATAFGLGSNPAAPAAALVVVGVVMVLASRRLRVLPDDPPEVVSKREQRRRERAGGA